MRGEHAGPHRLVYESDRNGNGYTGISPRGGEHPYESDGRKERLRNGGMVPDARKTNATSNTDVGNVQCTSYVGMECRPCAVKGLRGMTDKKLPPGARKYKT